MAECILDSNTKTVKLNRYRRMQTQNTEDENSFFKFTSYDEN